MIRKGEIPDFLEDTAGEFGKPNPPAPFPTREGGAGKPLSFVISHGLCWHDSSVNYSQQQRVAIVGQYVPKFIRPKDERLLDTLRSKDAEILGSRTHR